MDEETLLKFLKMAKNNMQNDYDNEREEKYPPLYSKDYLFGKLKATTEIIRIIETWVD